MATPARRTRIESPAASLIEELGAAMTAQYAALEEELIRLVAKYARQQLDTPLDVSTRLAVVRELKDRALELVDAVDPARLSREFIAIAESEGTAAAVRRLGLVNITSAESGFSAVSASAIGQITADLTADLAGMRPAILRFAPDVFQRATALTSGGVLGGVDTLRTAQRKQVQSLIARGVTYFPGNNPDPLYAKPWRIGSYAEMATRTAVNRAWQAGNIERLSRNELHLVQIIGGADACKVCARHFGKVYSTDGTPAGTYVVKSLTTGEDVTITVHGTLEQARADGWNHPNCRCVVTGVLPGVALTSSETTHDPEKEAARDRLRYLERQLRQARRMELAAMDDVDAAAWGRRVRARQAQIREHVAVSGTTRKPYRERLSFSDGPAASQSRALPRPRPVT